MPHCYGNSHATWDHSVTCHPASQLRLVFNLATLKRRQVDLT